MMHELSTLSVDVLQTLSLLAIAVNCEHWLPIILLIFDLLHCLLCLCPIIDTLVIVVFNQLARRLCILLKLESELLIFLQSIYG